MAGGALVGALLAACAATPPAPPEATACLSEAPPARHSSDYSQRLASLRARAAFFSGCMEARGYELDESKLSDELYRVNQVKNANPKGGDPQNALRLLEQELRATPAYWRKAPPGG